MVIEVPVPHHERYGHGSVVRVYANHIDVQLAEPLRGVHVVRIAREHWPSGRRSHLPTGQAPWQLGEAVGALFVYDLESAYGDDGMPKPDGHGFASITWGQRQDNPWDRGHSNHPAPGSSVVAQVHQPAGPDTVVVRFGTHDPAILLEGYLHRVRVPHGNGRGTPLHELLPVSMRLVARVIEVNEERCKVWLSVNEHLERREKVQGNGVPSLGTPLAVTPYVRLIDTQSDATVPRDASSVASGADNSPGLQWQAKRILLIDDDHHYLSALATWLRHFGAEVVEANNPRRARQVLNDSSAGFTHILVDIHLGTRQALLDLLPDLQRHQRQADIGMMTGMLDTDVLHDVNRLRAQRFGNRLALFSKPLDFALMDGWLARQQPPDDPAVHVPADYWRHPGSGVGRDVARRGRGWLQAVCRAAGAQAALWVRCHRPGYDIKAHHGLAAPKGDAERTAADLAALANDLARTLVADAEATGKVAHHHRAADAPWRALLSDRMQHAAAVPLARRHAQSVAMQVDDVLLLLSTTTLQAEQLLASLGWDELLMWWQDIQELEFLTDRLQEDAVFATQGRVHAATLHELRPLLQPFRSPRPWPAEEAQAWWPQGVKTLKLVEGGLYNIRAERVPEVLLRERLQALMEQFIWVFAQRRSVAVLVYLPASSLKITLPPEVFEQALINLVDNATKSCGHAGGGARVTVSMRVDAAGDPKRPLVISVDDQGTGMTPEQARQLFKPRATQRGAGGFGMGLYVSQRLAQSVGGELQLVRNERWSGCTFELRLPLGLGALPGMTPVAREGA